MRAEHLDLIRHANQLYNQKDYKNALKIYLATNYKDGMIRVADYFMYEEGKVSMAMQLYQRAGLQSRVDEWTQKAAELIQVLLTEDLSFVASPDTMDHAVSTDPSPDGAPQTWAPVRLSTADLIRASRSESSIAPPSPPQGSLTQEPRTQEPQVHDPQSREPRVQAPRVRGSQDA